MTADTTPSDVTSGDSTSASPLSLSRELLEAVRTDEPTADLERRLCTLDRDTVVTALATDAAAKAFWINCYNAFAQLPLRDDPRLFEDGRAFFGARRIPIAGRLVSLDGIEHGMLRRSRVKWGLGYLPRPFPSAFERALRVKRLDPRIHFALNCGAASCPPIAAYSAGEIDDELDLASESYLGQEVEFDARRNVVRVPRLCLWFYGDFKGVRGIRALLRRYGVIPAEASPRVRFRSYDWSLEVGDFRSDRP